MMYLGEEPPMFKVPWSNRVHPSSFTLTDSYLSLCVCVCVCVCALQRPVVIQVQSNGQHIGNADCRELRSLLEEYVRALFSLRLCLCRIR
jgi:hypothetical protein